MSAMTVIRQGGLAGKKIAVPFTSTAHYSLLATLENLNVDEKSVQLINLRPAEIAAAWERGDIDAAYVWEPALSQLKANGQILISGRDVRAWGKPTYDLWVADSKFAAQHPDVLAQFAAVTDIEVQWYQRNKNTIADFPDITGKIARLTGARPEDVPGVMAGSDYPVLKEQKQILTTTLADDIRNTALFFTAAGQY
ncbi:Sulfate starvation-induced protein 1 [Morganella morganii]|nr:Sulfate starvation-induced protein 1 [Morganella morganii]